MISIEYDIYQLFSSFTSKLSSYTLMNEHLPIDEKDKEDGLLDSTRWIWFDIGNPVAHITIDTWWKQDWVSLRDFEIEESYRGQGLSHEIIEFAKRHGVTHLSVSPLNKWIISLYEKHGFQLTGTKEGDLLRMEYPVSSMYLRNRQKLESKK